MSRRYVEIGFRDTNSEVISNTPQKSKQINPRGLPSCGMGHGVLWETLDSLIR